MAKTLGAKSVAATRAEYLQSLRKDSVEITVGGGGTHFNYIEQAKGYYSLHELALALPSAIAAPNPSYKAEWAQRIALLEKLRGQLTLSKALSVLLDISSSDELSLLLTHEVEVKRHGWHNAYAIGADSNGKLIWGGGYRLRTAADSAQTALDHCKTSAGNLCTVVSLNGDFKETNFRELVTRLGVQNVATVRNSFLGSLRKAPTTARVGSTTGICSTETCYSYGYASSTE